MCVCMCARSTASSIIAICIEKYLHTLFVHFFSLSITATITTNAAVSIYAFLGSSRAPSCCKHLSILGSLGSSCFLPTVTKSERENDQLYQWTH
jgi:hypothetical protein